MGELYLEWDPGPPPLVRLLSRFVQLMHLMFKWLELEREPTVAERKGQRKRRI